MSGDAFREMQEELRLAWLETSHTLLGGGMTTRKRLLELENDLEQTVKLYKGTRSRSKRQALNQLRYLLIREKNLLANHGKDDWSQL